MDRQLRGKFLVRRSTNKKGDQVVVLVGSFYPMNFETSEISNADEMWVADITIHEGGFKFTDCVNGTDAGSPEEFLEGQNQLPSDWKNKELL